MKTMWKNILLGIGLGSAVFVLMGIVFDILSGGEFRLSAWSYTKMAMGAMLVGIGFSVPSVIYENEKLSLGIQTLIHMGVGCTIFVVVAFVVGWIPLTAGWRVGVMTVLGQWLAAFVLWLMFALYYKRMAKKMNAKIHRERNR